MATEYLTAWFTRSNETFNDLRQLHPYLDEGWEVVEWRPTFKPGATAMECMDAFLLKRERIRVDPEEYPYPAQGDFSDPASGNFDPERLGLAD